jgi:uncharacterized iron-regulated membrane protein
VPQATKASQKAFDREELLQRTANTAGGVWFGRARGSWSSSVRRWAGFLHAWIGVTTVLYLLALCLSGCIVLFERDLYRLLSPDPIVEPVSVPRLSGAELINISFSRYPEHRVVGVWDKKISAAVIAEVWLEGRNGLHRRLLNPYTGADLGNARPLSLRVLSFIRQGHINLVTGTVGQIVNGLAALVLMLLAVSSLLSLVFRKPGSRPLGNATPSLHRQIGFWMIPFASLWGATGLVLSVPSLFGDDAVEWAYALHTGTGGGSLITALWAASSLLTSVLLVAGAWAWWHKPAKSPQVQVSLQFLGPPSSSSAADMDFPSGRVMDRAAATKGSDLAR